MARRFVLVVEDDDSIGQTLLMLLDSEGIASQLSTTRDDALAHMKVLRPDLILLDWLGYEECMDIVKTAKSYKEKTPIVLVTARNECDKLAKMIGVDMILKKPFTVEHLMEYVDKFIGPEDHMPKKLQAV